MPQSPSSYQWENQFFEGLSEGEAARQLERDGPNQLPTQEYRPWYTVVTDTLKEPMVAILLGCGGIYLVLGDQTESLLLLGFLILIVAITIYQENKAEKALIALRNLSSPRALVIRDHNKRRIAGKDVVRGDLIILCEGDRIPADGFLLQATGLQVDESLLTGESTSVHKQPQDTMAPFTAEPPALSRVFAGTSIIKGQGLMRVTQTGSHTQIGQIGTLIQNVEFEPTRMEEETRHLVKVVAIIALSCCVLVTILYAMTSGNSLSGVLAGLTLAMAILPNELPAVLTIFLSLGAWRLSRQRILTRRPSAIEALGSANVLCVDKTGTLTYNRMALKVLHVDGKSYDLSTFDRNELPEEVHQLIEFGILAGDKEPQDPIDRALNLAGKTYLQNTEHLHDDWDLARHYPSSKDLFALSYVWNSHSKKPFPVAAKGAPEAIFDLCHLEGSTLQKLTLEVTQLASQGLRLIAVAKAEHAAEGLPDHPHAFDFEFVGILGLEDPIRREVPKAISECHQAGIRVVMITGDHPQTACSIARSIGLPYPESFLLGEDLKKMDDDTLKERLPHTHIFARMVPEEKLRLVKLLKSLGATVAMTGDGVNDAPALKEANIGIAMGQRGTDVAREAADLVLLDDDFTSLVSSIRMGRRIYHNLQSAISYLLAVHIPIAGISVIPLFFKMPLVLSPIHVALLHLIIEPACSIAFEAEPAPSNVMNLPPRKIGDKLFTKKIMLPTLFKGMSVLAAILCIFFFTADRTGLKHHDEAVARTLTFVTLMSANMGLIGSHRLTTLEIKRKTGTGKNSAFYLVLMLSCGLLASGLLVPEIRSILHFKKVTMIDAFLAIFLGFLSSTLPVFIYGNRWQRNNA